MWAQVINNEVTRIIKSPIAITINNIQHPSSIFANWSKAELAAIGILPYREESQSDQRYYHLGSVTYAINPDEVVGSYTSTPRDIAQLKEQMLIKIDATAKSLINSVTGGYSSGEMTQWAELAREADTLVADPMATAPLITAEAAEVGATPVEYAAKIKTKSDAWLPFRRQVIAQRTVKAAEVATLTTLDQIIAYENHSVIETRYIKHTSTEGIETYGPETETHNRTVSKVTDYGWPVSPTAKPDPAFVSMTDAP